MSCYTKIYGDTIEITKCYASLRALAELKQLSDECDDSLDENSLEVENHGDWFTLEVRIFGNVSASDSSEFTTRIQALGPWTRKPAQIKDWSEDNEEWDNFWVASSSEAVKIAGSEATMTRLAQEAQNHLLPIHLDELIEELQAFRRREKRAAKKAQKG